LGGIPQAQACADDVCTHDDDHRVQTIQRLFFADGAVCGPDDLLLCEARVRAAAAG